jgi:hypothetical protein
VSAAGSTYTTSAQAVADVRRLNVLVEHLDEARREALKIPKVRQIDIKRADRTGK